MPAIGHLRRVVMDAQLHSRLADVFAQFGQGFRLDLQFTVGLGAADGIRVEIEDAESGLACFGGRLRDALAGLRGLTQDMGRPTGIECDRLQPMLPQLIGKACVVLRNGDVEIAFRVIVAGVFQCDQDFIEALPEILTHPPVILPPTIQL